MEYAGHQFVELPTELDIVGEIPWQDVAAFRPIELFGALQNRVRAHFGFAFTTAHANSSTFKKWTVSKQVRSRIQLMSMPNSLDTLKGILGLRSVVIDERMPDGTISFASDDGCVTIIGRLRDPD